jgi:predicted exporter
MARQNANATLWSERAPLALARLDSFLRDAGVGIDFTGAPPVPRDPAAFCALVEGYSPLRACARGPGGDLFAIVTLTPASAAASSPARWAREAGGRAWSLDAEPYYDSILTGFSRELGWLFLVGLAAMACYLYALHRSLRALLYIFLPVLLAATVVSIWLSSGRGEVNVIHMLAFSLVIALCVDYSSVALSSRYSAGELSRVLITGLSTLAGFGALAAAKHPVLRDLGMVVSLGAGMSLAFALFVRFLPEVRDAP